MNDYIARLDRVAAQIVDASRSAVAGRLEKQAGKQQAQAGRTPQKQVARGRTGGTYLGWNFVAAGVWSKTACPKCTYGLENGKPVKQKPGPGNRLIPVKINRTQGNQIIKAINAIKNNKDPNFQRCNRLRGVIKSPANWKACIKDPNWRP